MENAALRQSPSHDMQDHCVKVDSTSLSAIVDAIKRMQKPLAEADKVTIAKLIDQYLQNLLNNHDVVKLNFDYNSQDNAIILTQHGWRFSSLSQRLTEIKANPPIVDNQCINLCCSLGLGLSGLFCL